jgi:molybdopterin-binding protein
MATIRIRFGEDIVTSVISKDAMEDMGIRVGDRVTAIMDYTRVRITR